MSMPNDDNRGRGDGKVALALLERMEPADFSPRQIVATEDVKPVMDLSGLTDEEFEIVRRYEELMEKLQQRAERESHAITAPVDEDLPLLEADIDETEEEEASLPKAIEVPWDPETWSAPKEKEPWEK